MSTPPNPPAPVEGTIACPRCATPVGPEQNWCLACGAAARTRLAGTPNWRTPVVVLGAILALSAAALAGAFVALTNDDVPQPAAATATTPPAAAPAPPPDPAAPAADPPAAPPQQAVPAPPETVAPPAVTTPPAGTLPDG